MANFDTIEARRFNIVWTVAGDYDILPDPAVLSSSTETVNHYREALVGAFYRYTDTALLSTLVDYYKNATVDAPLFLTLLDIALELCLYPLLTQERPGIKHLHTQYAMSFLNRFYHRPPSDVAEEVELAMNQRFFKRVPKTSPMVIALLDDFQALSPFQDTPSFVLGFREAISRHFHIETTLKKESDLEKAIESSKSSFSSKKKPTRIDMKRPQNAVEIEDIGSAEFTKDIEIENQTLKESTPTLLTPSQLSNHIMFQRMTSQFGESLLSERQRAQLEATVSTGNHIDHHILLTAGEFREDINAQFYQRIVDHQTTINIEHYEDNQLLYKRSIVKLMDIIRNSVLMDLDTSESRTLDGTLTTQNLWRHTALKDQRVFHKNRKDEIGTLSVDLLLDASASQIDRQALVASQAYIIQEAFTRLRIPTRVFSYNSLYNFTVLKLFRDYKDPLSSNQRVFGYNPSGSNRDGFALRTVLHWMASKQDATNRILIVLTDGRPDDRRSPVDNQSYTGVKKYTGVFAVEDTAIEVRKGRDRNISILGVFTGEEDDLPSVQRIYGYNFAHIKRIERFSDIVGLFMKNELINLE